MNYTKVTVAKKSLFRFLIISLLLLIGTAYLYWPASALQNTILAVEPADVGLPLGNQVLLKLSVSDGDNINSFDVTLNYDSQILSLAYWMHGEYLQNVTCLQVINQPGFLRLDCNQVARPGVSGDGVLLELVFNTVDDGLSELRIDDATFTNADGTVTSPSLQHGLVDVLIIPTYTPTTTNTPTPSVTPTATVTTTPTMTQAITATPIVTATITAISTRTPTLETVTQPVAEVVSTTDTMGEDPQLRWPAGTATSEPFTVTETPVVDVPEETLTPVGQLESEEIDTQSGSAYLLWGIFIFGLVVLAIIIGVRIWRNSKISEQDLL